MSSRWFLDSVAAMLLLGVAVLLLKQLTILQISISVILFYICVLTTLIYVIHIRGKLNNLKSSKALIVLVFAAAIASYLGNVFLVHAIANAPNPGYPIAIESFRIPLTALAEVLFFGNRLTSVELAGGVCCLLGISLISV